MDLFAYNEDAFKTWVSELEHVASRNAAAGDGVAALGVRNSSVYSRPLSSHSSVSRASVSPSNARVPEHDHHMTGSGVHESGRISTSIFTVPEGSEQTLSPADARVSVNNHHVTGGDVRESSRTNASIFTVPEGSEAAVSPADMSSRKQSSAQKLGIKSGPFSKRTQVSPSPQSSVGEVMLRNTPLENFIGESFKARTPTNTHDHVTSDDII